MTDQEAILRIEDHMRVHKIGEPPHVFLAEALTIALGAIEERIERSKNEPLTLQDLKQRCGKPIFYLFKNGVSGWMILNDVEEITTENGTTVILHSQGDTHGGHKYGGETRFFDKEAKLCE